MPSGLRGLVSPGRVAELRLPLLLMPEDGSRTPLTIGGAWLCGRIAAALHRLWP